MPPRGQGRGPAGGARKGLGKAGASIRGHPGEEGTPASAATAHPKANIVNIIKKSITNIILNGEKLKAFPL